MIKHKFLLLISWAIRLTLLWLPEATLFSKLRGALYRLFLPECGSNFQVSSNVRIINLENLYIGDNVYLAPGVIINAIDDIILESEVMVGFNCVIVSGNHSKTNNSFRFGASITNPIRIGYGSWIAANCTIVAGANIGKCVLIAANSLVKGLLPDNSKCFGVPARPLIPSDEQKHLMQ